LIALIYAPYYFTYFNPLLGGALTAPHLVGIGWGEGMDEVGRWLNTQPDAQVSTLGARYTATLHPFYAGQVSSPVKAGVDYVAFYIKQTQSGYPTPEILAYFEQQGALHRVKLAGIDYAQIYRGPAMILLDNRSRTDFPLAYRPYSLYAPIGGALTVDLLWAAEYTPPPGQNSIRLSLKSAEGRFIAASQAPVKTVGPAVNVSQHTLALPADLARETYRLTLNGQPLDMIKARSTEMPPDFVPLDFVAQNLKLKGYRFEQIGQDLVVELAWQSWPQATTDFTVYVQLLDAQGRRRAGVDVVPTPRFPELDRKEVSIARYLLPLSPDLAPDTYHLLVGLYYFAGDELINVGSATLPEPVHLKALVRQD
jgi:hypothetical protein